jgi:hypothetical protein
MAYAVIELRTLVKLAVGDVDGDRLMKDFLTRPTSPPGSSSMSRWCSTRRRPARKAFLATSR